MTPPYKPVDKLENRVAKNFLSATAMLGHLCALYDRSVFEAGRLMSNLLFQLAVSRKSTNVPLLKQIGVTDALRVVVDTATLGKNVSLENMTPLAGFMFGLRRERAKMVPTAYWVPVFRRPGPAPPFAALSIDEWLNDPVIPTTKKILSRKDLIDFVRDQDGGAHSDPDERLQKSIDYVELVNSFSVSKMSHVKTPDGVTFPWESLPPVTMPILRQISHELLSAIYSQTDVRQAIYLPSLVSIFEGTDIKCVCVPEGYSDVGLVYDKAPAVISRPVAD